MLNNYFVNLNKIVSIKMKKKLLNRLCLYNFIKLRKKPKRIVMRSYSEGIVINNILGFVQNICFIISRYVSYI